MNAIYSKELRTYFTSLTGYLFIGLFLAIVGLYHFVYTYNYGATQYAYTLDGVTIFFIFLIPLLTMRILAEEKKQKTDQLLYTSPVSIAKVVLGKYLAMLTLLVIVMAIICIQPLVVTLFGTVNLAADYLAIFGFFLIGAAYLALGMFISQISESQVFSAIITFFVILVSCLIDAIVSLFDSDAKTAWIVFMVCFALLTVLVWTSMRNILVSAIFFAVTEISISVVYFMDSLVLEGSLEKVFSWFSILSRFDKFRGGIFSLADTVYYLSVIGLFIFLTIQNAKKRRWD